MELEEGSAAAAAAAAGPAESPSWQQDFAQLLFQLQSPVVPEAEKAELRKQVLQHVEKHEMGPVYTQLVADGLLESNAALAEKLASANSAALAAHEAAIADAREKHGDVEVYEAQQRKAELLGRIGDKAGCLAAYAAIAPRSMSTGQRIDAAMSLARLAMATADWPLAAAKVAEAQALNDAGGDWDRRNRLKVYAAMLKLAGRDFAGAAELLLDGIATFTAVELQDYRSFIFYTVLACLKSLERTRLKKKVLDSPDVLSVIHEVPHLQALLSSFYEGRYRDFLQAAVGIFPALQRDRLLSAHATFYLRELRLAAYAQFLESYRSVTLAGMCRAFGLGADFLDRELSRFIASGRLNAKLDAVGGIIETTRPDSKNAQYAAVLKQGDALLNKVQKLSRVVTL